MIRSHRSRQSSSPRRIREAPVEYPSTDQIAELAHELFITGGRRVARIPEYWRAAETELLNRAARTLRNPDCGMRTDRGSRNTD